MSELTTNLSSFIRETKARIEGDTAAVIAEKNFRKGRAAISGTVNSLESRLVDHEEAVAEAQEKYNNALYPDTLISEGKYYVANITSALEGLESAKNTLENTQKNLELFKNLLAEKF